MTDPQIALRFVSFCTILDSLLVTHPHYKTTLKRWVASCKGSTIDFTRTGQVHYVCQRYHSNDSRRALPRAINNLIRANFNPDWSLTKKITIAWVVCYLNDIYPDMTQSDWKYYECSHRCVEYNLEARYICIDPDCLVWESKAINQSRGQQFCVRNCVHQGCEVSVCECQGIHDPPCL